MHDQPPRAQSGLHAEHIEHLVLHMLQEPGGPPMWSVAELASELGSETDAEAAVAHLRAAGLVHRQGPFVFPSRATMRMMQLAAW